MVPVGNRIDRPESPSQVNARTMVSTTIGPTNSNPLIVSVPVLVKCDGSSSALTCLAVPARRMNPSTGYPRLRVSRKAAAAMDRAVAMPFQHNWPLHPENHQHLQPVADS